jgi:hypothetical protein
LSQKEFIEEPIKLWYHKPLSKAANSKLFEDKERLLKVAVTETLNVLSVKTIEVLEYLDLENALWVWFAETKQLESMLPYRRPAQDEGTAYSSWIRAGNCWLISGHNQGIQSLGLAVTTSMQEANAEVVEGSAYRMPVSLNVSRMYIELNVFEENRPAAGCMQRHWNQLLPWQWIWLLCTFQRMLPAHAAQSSLDAYFKSENPDSDSCECCTALLYVVSRIGTRVSPLSTIVNLCSLVNWLLATKWFTNTHSLLNDTVVNGNSALSSRSHRTRLMLVLGIENRGTGEQPDRQMTLLSASEVLLVMFARFLLFHLKVGFESKVCIGTCGDK